MEVLTSACCGSEWPTVPQVYVKGEFVGDNCAALPMWCCLCSIASDITPIFAVRFEGGCDIMINMHQDGELAELLADSGIKKE